MWHFILHTSNHPGHRGRKPVDLILPSFPILIYSIHLPPKYPRYLETPAIPNHCIYHMLILPTFWFLSHPCKTHSPPTQPLLFYSLSIALMISELPTPHICILRCLQFPYSGESMHRGSTCLLTA